MKSTILTAELHFYYCFPEHLASTESAQDAPRYHRLMFEEKHNFDVSSCAVSTFDWHHYQPRLDHTLSMTSPGGSATMSAFPRVNNPANIQYSRMVELSHRHTNFSRLHMVVGKNRELVEFVIAICRSLVHGFMVEHQKIVTWHPTTPHILLENVTNTMNQHGRM